MFNKLLSTVLCHNILISRMGQRVCFQITLPRDTVRVVGIETGIRSYSPLIPSVRDYTGGLLTFQTAGSNDLCYSSYVKVEQKVTIKTDLSYTAFLAGFTTWNRLMADVALHSGHREPDTLDIPAPRILIGTYTDQWGAGMTNNITYGLSIYLWVTIDDLYNTPCQ
jgi:hypothetical protein